MRILLFFLTAAILISCGDEKIKPQVDTSSRTEDLPTQESDSSTILFTEKGLKKAIVYADKIYMYAERSETLLENVKIDFFNEEGEKASKLTAKHGRVDDLTKNMYAHDSVVAVNDSGMVLRTDELMWNNKNRKITTEEFVTIESPVERIEGYGFESDQTLSNYVIYKITYVTSIDNTEK